MTALFSTRRRKKYAAKFGRNTAPPLEAAEWKKRTRD